MEVILGPDPSFRKDIFIYLPGSLAFCFLQRQLALLFSSLTKTKEEQELILATLPTEKKNTECLEEGRSSV